MKSWIEQQTIKNAIRNTPIHNREQLNSIVDSLHTKPNYYRMGSAINRNHKSLWRTSPRIRKYIVEIPLHQIIDDENELTTNTKESN